MGKPVSGTLIKIDSSPELEKLLSPGTTADHQYAAFSYWKSGSTSQTEVGWTSSWVGNWIIKQ